MRHIFHDLSRPALSALAAALLSGRLTPPYRRSGLRGLVPEDERVAVRDALRTLGDDGMEPRHIGRMLELLAEARRETQRMADRVRLVWSPPELDHIDARDTSAVVRDLFAEAKTSVDIVTYALDAGEKAEVLFGDLAARMDADASLKVRVFANAHRDYKDDTTPPAEIVAAFAKRFVDKVWSGARKPDLFYDPRSVEIEYEKRASLHAKVVIIDRRKAFITSANFTEAAQARNIEVGVVIDDVGVAGRMAQQLDLLALTGALIQGSSAALSVSLRARKH